MQPLSIRLYALTNSATLNGVQIGCRIFALCKKYNSFDYYTTFLRKSQRNNGKYGKIFLNLSEYGIIFQNILRFSFDDA